MSEYVIKEAKKGWQIIGPNKEVVGKYTYPHEWKAMAYLKLIQSFQKAGWKVEAE